MYKAFTVVAKFKLIDIQPWRRNYFPPKWLVLIFISNVSQFCSFISDASTQYLTTEIIYME